jgi:hypothetical protein
MIQDFVFLVLEYPDISFKIKHGINSFMLNPLFLANKCTLDPIPRLYVQLFKNLKIRIIRKEKKLLKDNRD